MSLSRDEAREIAAVALMLTIGLRIAAGVFQLIEEAQRESTWRSLLGRFLAPVGSTLGLLALALALLLVLSPTGSISMRAMRLSTNIVGFIAVLGAVSVVNGLTSGLGDVLNRLWFVLINGFAAAILGGAAWWILRNFDPQR
jgi:hypothetical protein